MGTEFNNQDTQKTGSPDLSNNFLKSTQNSLISGFVVFLILALLVGAIIYQRIINLKQDKEQVALNEANNAMIRLQESLSISLSATKTLSFFIQNDGTIRDFDSIAPQIFNATKDIDALQLVPDGVIRYMYPLKGNEKAMGYDILNDSARSKEAYKAIEKRELYFAGPFELKQGGLGVVGRLPIFRNNKFWGFSAVVIKMPTLLRSAGIDTTGKNGFYFQLSKINPDTQEEEYFIKTPHARPNKKTISVNVPNGEWKLSVTPVSLYQGYDDIIFFAILGFLFSVLGGIFVYNIVRRPEKLDKLVTERTGELLTSENKYRTLIERVTDAFISLDNKGNYTYVNKKAGEIYEMNTETLIGKNIWTTFPDGIDKVFYNKCNNAFNSQEYQYLEEFYPPFGKWIESHIYPSKDGLTIFFKDVTVIKKISSALKENEAKYRSLIEQASDGIVITGLEGTIQEINNSITAMTGYSLPDIRDKNLYQFFAGEQTGISLIQVEELKAGKSILYERKLIKKDGTHLDVEINSKLASVNTLIGFIRDISSRKKNEENLQYQAMLLDNVSDAIYSLDNNREIISWNHASEELFGFKEGYVLGKKIPELISFEYPNNNIEKVFAQVFREGKWTGEFNFIHPDKKIRTHLLSNINLLKNKDNECIGFIITSKDISLRKRAEEEVKFSNERFELIAQATNEVIWDHDFIKNETWGNKNLYGLYGSEFGKVKINFEMFLERLHPDEREGVEERLKNAMQNSVSSISEEFLFKTASGDYRTYYDRAYIKYDETGQPTRILGAMQDITEREIIKNQILREKELSDSIVNRLPGIFYLFNKEGRFLRWNKNFETVTGYTYEEISNMHPLDFFDEKEKELISLIIAKVIDTGEEEVEAGLLLKNKQKIPYYFNGQRIQYEGEICIMGVGLDFSERVNAAGIILESEEKYRTLVEQASDAIFIADKEGKFIIVNSSGLKMTQYSLEEIEKLKIYDLVPPEDIKNKPFHFKDMENGKVARVERSIKRKDGTILEVEITAKFINGDRFLAFVRDLSDIKKAAQQLKENEERLRLSLDAAKQGLYDVNVKTGETIVNEQYAIMLGYDPATFVETNSYWLERLHPDDYSVTSQAYLDYSSGKTTEYKVEFRQRTKDNEWKWILSLGKIVEFDRDGKPLRMLGTHTDITTQKKAEAEIQANTELLRELYTNSQMIREEERTYIAREIHDELGQQLTGLKMDLSWLNRKLKLADETIKEKLSGTINLVDMTIKTVRKIATELRPSILDDLGLVAALDWQGEEFGKRSDIQVTFTSNLVEPILPPDIATAIFRIYQELLTNIARHSSASKVYTFIQMTDEKLLLSVEDNGVGFDAEAIIIKKTLGLRGIKERTNLIGGEYNIKSSPGGGTFVLISVPLHKILINP